MFCSLWKSRGRAKLQTGSSADSSEGLGRPLASLKLLGAVVVLMRQVIALMSIGSALLCEIGSLSDLP
jgi:hypothetical protein